MFYCVVFGGGISANITELSLNMCHLLTGIRAYEQLGYRAFGTPGKMAAGIAITLQNIGGEEPMLNVCALYMA